MTRLIRTISMAPSRSRHKGRLTVLLLRFSCHFLARFQVVVGTVMQIGPAMGTYGVIMFVSLISVLLDKMLLNFL